MKRPEAGKPGQGPTPLPEQNEPQISVLEHYRRELDERLDEITAWLALEQNKRAPMHAWMDHFQKGDYVFREMMSDADRTRLLKWLERSIAGAAERTLQWTSQSTGLLYTASEQGTISSNQDVCWGVNLTVDLNPVLGLKNNRRYLEQSYPRFYRNADGTWNVKPIAGRR